jgi:hypothetical protein
MRLSMLEYQLMQDQLLVSVYFKNMVSEVLNNNYIPFVKSYNSMHSSCMRSAFDMTSFFYLRKSS